MSETKVFSAGSLSERLRIAMKEPRMRTRMTIRDYKQVAAKYSNDKEKNAEQLKALRNLFISDIQGILNGCSEAIIAGKTYNTLLGLSSIDKELAKIGQKLSVEYRRVLKQEDKTGTVTSAGYKKVKVLYVEFLEKFEQIIFGE